MNNNNYFLGLFKQYPEAEGIDFYPLQFLKWPIRNIICNYTKEELNNPIAIPKTPYSLWRIVDGKKVYLT